MQWLDNKELKGKYVTLEPLSLLHVNPLKEAVLDGES